MTLSIVHLLNRTVDIKRQSLVSDGQGGFSNTFAAVVTGVKGRRQAASGNERLVAGREEALVSHVWYFDAGVNVRNRDVLESNGIQDEVISVLPPSRDDFMKVAVKEIQIGG